MFKQKLMMCISVYLLLLTGCDLGQFTQTKELDDFIISVTNDPHPIIVNEPVKFYATLRREQKGVSRCMVTVVKTPLRGAEAASAETLEVPESGTSDIYHVKNVIFPQAGEWELTYKVDCGGRKREASFPMLVTNAKN